MILKWFRNRGNAESHQTGCFVDKVAFQHIDGAIVTTKKVISAHEGTLEGSSIVWFAFALKLIMDISIIKYIVILQNDKSIWDDSEQ